MSVLVKRTVGGLGDILMLAPSLLELAKTDSVFLQVPQNKFHNYLWLFSGTAVVVVDKEVQVDRVIDCDRGFVYHEQFSTKVRNRIDLFAELLEAEIEVLPALPAFRDLEVFNNTLRPIVVLDSSCAEKKRTWPLKSQVQLRTMLEPVCEVIVLDFNKMWDPDPQVFQNLNLVDVCKVIKSCDLFVGSDSGLSHVAGFMKKPAVVMFGPVPPESRTSWYSEHYGLSSGTCPPCWYKLCDNDNKCMKDISALNVFTIIKDRYDYLF